MRGMVAVEDVIASLPRKRQKAIEARGKELLARIERRMTLRAVRKERGVTQEAIASALGIGQVQISRLEQRRDPRLSTIERTIAALGGELKLIATFPDQEPVLLEIASAGKPVAKKKARPKAA